jgi:hypothetical protein
MPVLSSVGSAARNYCAAATLDGVFELLEQGEPIGLAVGRQRIDRWRAGYSREVAQITKRSPHCLAMAASNEGGGGSKLRAFDNHSDAIAFNANKLKHH